MSLFGNVVYQVQTNLTANNQSSAAFYAITKSAEGMTAAVDGAKRALHLLGVGYGFHELKKHLFDFNAQLEDYRVKMAGMLTMFTKADMAKSWERAGESVDTFNVMAAKSALTTKELVNMASLIERPLLSAGVSMSQIEELTFGAANAAKAFGTETGLAARDIEYMLTRGVHIRDRFGINLLNQRSIHLTPEQFNAKSAFDRAKIVGEALKSPEILEMARKQGQETFHGVMSTLEDNMQLLGGRIGSGVFHEISLEIRSWNEWMQKNQIEIDKFANVVKTDLVTGFKYLKEVAGFLVDNGDTLMAIGKVWIAAQVGSSIGGALGMGGGNLKAILGTFSPIGQAITAGIRNAMIATAIHVPGMAGVFGSLASGAGRLGAFASGLGGAAGALGPAGILGLGYAAHELGEYLGVHRAITAVIDPTRVKLEHLKASMEVLDDQVKRTAASMADEKGGLGTTTAKNALGVVDFMKQQVNVLGDIQNARGGIAGQSARFNRAAIWGRLRAAGFDDDEIKNRHLDTRAGRMVMLNELSLKEQMVGGRTFRASHDTDMGIEAALKLMSQTERNSLDMKKGYEIIMQKFVQLMNSGGFGMFGVVDRALMSPEGIKRILLAEALDPFKGAMVNQNITNHINVEVSAKDPDRWLLEVDQKMQRKIRAPSQAKGSIITRGGL